MCSPRLGALNRAHHGGANGNGLDDARQPRKGPEPPKPKAIAAHRKPSAGKCYGDGVPGEDGHGRENQATPTVPKS